MAQTPDFYSVLEVAHSVGNVELKKAYRRLVRRFHPDTNAAPDAVLRFQEIQLAYETLSDPLKRKAYDRTRLQSGTITHVGKEPPLSAAQVLQQSEDLLKYLQKSSGTGINYDALADFIMGILAPESVFVLSRNGDPELNSKLLNNLLDASEKILAVRAFTQIAERMLQLKPKLTEEVVQRIQHELHARIKREKQHRLVPVAALIMVFVFVLIMILFLR